MIDSAIAPTAAEPANVIVTNTAPAMRLSPWASDCGRGSAASSTARSAVMCHRKATPASGTR